jgi:hypothetical protein
MLASFLSGDCWKSDVDCEAAARARCRGDGGVVGIGDRLHDHEAEPNAVAAPRSESLEWLEETLKVAGNDDGTRVRDGEMREPRLGTGRKVDPAAGHVVPDGIRDEIGNEALEQLRVAARESRFEHDCPFESAQVVSPKRLIGKRREVDRDAPCQPAFTASETQARLEQSLLLQAGVEDIRTDLAPARDIRGRIGKRELQQCALRRQRRAQLMRDEGGLQTAHEPSAPL